MGCINYRYRNGERGRESGDVKVSVPLQKKKLQDKVNSSLFVGFRQLFR